MNIKLLLCSFLFLLSFINNNFAGCGCCSTECSEESSSCPVEKKQTVPEKSMNESELEDLDLDGDDNEDLD